MVREGADRCRRHRRSEPRQRGRRLAQMPTNRAIRALVVRMLRSCAARQADLAIQTVLVVRGVALHRQGRAFKSRVGTRRAVPMRVEGTWPDVAMPAPFRRTVHQAWRMAMSMGQRGGDQVDRAQRDHEETRRFAPASHACTPPGASSRLDVRCPTGNDRHSPKGSRFSNSKQATRLRKRPEGGDRGRRWRHWAGRSRSITESRPTPGRCDAQRGGGAGTAMVGKAACPAGVLEAGPVCSSRASAGRPL